MKISSRCIIIMCVVMLFALFGTAWADATLTFSGKLTVTAGGEQTKIDSSESITVSEILTTSTQDDDPGVMAGLFEEEGFTRKKAAITVKTSKKFTVSGEGVNGVYALKGRGDDARLESVGGNKSPYIVPAKKGDYYIGIDYEYDEDEEVDAAVLQYVKITLK